jgi:hypothetical protein
MSNPLHRELCCRDLAEECGAIAVLCAPSTEIRAHYPGCQSITAHWQKPTSWARRRMGISHFDSSDLTDGV